MRFSNGEHTMTLSNDRYDAIAARARLLMSGKTMEEAMDRMAAEITEALADKDPLILCVMTGAVIVTGRLLPRLNFQLRLDYLHATRYRGDTRGGELVWLHRPSEAVRGQHVLVVDDILDEGVTLDAAVRACREDGATSVQCAVLVEKERKRAVDFRADFVGVKVPNLYVYGCGLDYKGYFRNVDAIYAVASEDA